MTGTFDPPRVFAGGIEDWLILGVLLSASVLAQVFLVQRNRHPDNVHSPPLAWLRASLYFAVILVLSWAAGAAVLAALVGGVANAQLGERRSVWPGVPSWATGLALLAVGAVAAAASSRRPRFPADSGLEGSRFARRVRLR